MRIELSHRYIKPFIKNLNRNFEAPTLENCTSVRQGPDINFLYIRVAIFSLNQMKKSKPLFYLK